MKQRRRLGFPAGRPTPCVPPPSALLAFVIFGPLANLLLWAFAERWYFPNKLPQEFGFAFWERVFQPRGNALQSLVHQRLDRAADGGLLPGRGDSRGLCAGAAEAALARR